MAAAASGALSGLIGFPTAHPGLAMVLVRQVYLGSDKVWMFRLFRFEMPRNWRTVLFTQHIRAMLKVRLHASVVASMPTLTMMLLFRVGDLSGFSLSVLKRALDHNPLQTF